MEINLKINNLSDVTKILIIAAATIITCIIVGIGFSALHIAKQLSSNTIDDMVSLNHDLIDNDIKMFDATEVTGSDVINFIKKQLGDYEVGETAPLYITIKSNISEYNHTNKEHIESIRDFRHMYYIKPTAIFKGEVIKNENEVILGVSFIQK